MQEAVLLHDRRDHEGSRCVGVSITRDHEPVAEPAFSRVADLTGALQTG